MFNNLIDKEERKEEIVKKLRKWYKDAEKRGDKKAIRTYRIGAIL